VLRRRSKRENPILRRFGQLHARARRVLHRVTRGHMGGDHPASSRELRTAPAMRQPIRLRILSDIPIAYWRVCCRLCRERPGMHVLWPVLVVDYCVCLVITLACTARIPVSAAQLRCKRMSRFGRRLAAGSSCASHHSTSLCLALGPLDTSSDTIMVLHAGCVSRQVAAVQAA
jgi:hypothetical protein